MLGDPDTVTKLKMASPTPEGPGETISVGTGGSGGLEWVSGPSRPPPREPQPPEDSPTSHAQYALEELLRFRFLFFF